MKRTKRLTATLLALMVCLSAVIISGSYYEQSDYYPSIDLYCGNNYDGTYIWSANYDEQIDYVSFIEGSLPSGMYTYNDSSSIILNGTPTKEGTFYARYCVETSMRRAIVNLQVYVKHNPSFDPVPQPTPAPVGTAPRLTKSPAGETVNAGGSALFIARAENYTGIAWFLVRSDYGTAIPAEKIGDYFEGAWASNYYSEKITIGGIPKSMNGWMVMCYFNNSYGETWSGAAPIYVNSPAPTPAPTPQPTPVPTPAPTAEQPLSDADTNHFETLNIHFFPFKDTASAESAVKFLPVILKQEMAEQGFVIDNVNIEFGDTYADCGEALASGAADIAWIPSGTYAAYMDSAAVMLTAASSKLSNDSIDAASWNGDKNKTRATEEQVNAYRGLILAAPSAYGKTLSEKVARGEKLSWEDLDKATWAVQKTISSAGYIYPSMWLMNNYEGKGIDDLSNVIPLNGYRRAVLMAAEEQVDIILLYGDARMEYENLWTAPVSSLNGNGQLGMGRSDSIWDELQVIAVTEPIYNDVIAISKLSPFYSANVTKALQSVLINTIENEAGKAMFSIYDHSDYLLPNSDTDYRVAFEAMYSIKKANKADIMDLPDSAEGNGETIVTPLNK